MHKNKENQEQSPTRHKVYVVHLIWAMSTAAAALSLCGWRIQVTLEIPSATSLQYIARVTSGKIPKYPYKKFANYMAWWAVLSGFTLHIMLLPYVNATCLSLNCNASFQGNFVALFYWNLSSRHTIDAYIYTHKSNDSVCYIYEICGFYAEALK